MTTKFHDGQRYELVRTEPYTRTDGSETELSVRQSECPVCVCEWRRYHRPTDRPR